MGSSCADDGGLRDGSYACELGAYVELRERFRDGPAFSIPEMSAPVVNDFPGVLGHSCRQAMAVPRQQVTQIG